MAKVHVNDEGQVFVTDLQEGAVMSPSQANVLATALQDAAAEAAGVLAETARRARAIEEAKEKKHVDMW